LPLRKSPIPGPEQQISQLLTAEETGMSPQRGPDQSLEPPPQRPKAEASQRTYYQTAARRLNASQLSHGPGRVGDELQGQNAGHQLEGARSEGESLKRGTDQRQPFSSRLHLGQGQHGR